MQLYQPATTIHTRESMEYRRLGKSGLRVPALSFGTATIGGGNDYFKGWGATEVVTGATELATVQLGEGSVVRLAPSSRLRVLAGRERAVSLEGRAFASAGLSRDFQTPPEVPLVQGGTKHFASSGSSTH